jgi:low affinity Fe/Cu permease
MARNKRPLLSKFLIWSARTAGQPAAFIIALFILVMWGVGGLIWGFSDKWLLIINTLATINASLMVFIIQNTQYRENKALHLKIDELLRVNKESERELIAIEEKEEKELEELREKMNLKRREQK